MKPLIAPSILAANFNHLEKDIEVINRSEAGFVHCDVMDGVFVPNISFGIPVIKHVKKVAKKPLDVHLMIVDPDRFVADFAEAGANYLTVHYEVCSHLHRTVSLIKEHGMKASVCLNPHTPVAVLEDIIHELDMVLLMSVNPGFGGQKFIPNTYKKVQQLRTLINKTETECLIEVDGGVNFETGEKLVKAGADVLVAGSFVFKSANPEGTINQLKKL